MILIRLCDDCGSQFSYDDDDIISCHWCGKEICINCERIHNCIKGDEEDE